jgi:uncharacterized repeat protein (TIGR01451 family)
LQFGRSPPFSLTEHLFSVFPNSIPLALDSHRRLSLYCVVTAAIGLASCLVLLPLETFAQNFPAGRAKAPQVIRQALDRGLVQDVIVQFDDTAVRNWADDTVRQRRLPHEDAQIIEGRAARMRAIKRRAFDGMGTGVVEELRDYPQLPLALVRLRDAAALDRLIARAEVAEVFVDGRKFSTLDTTSAALIGQPTAEGLGYIGNGSTVLVIDGGVNYTLPEFGSCTAPGVPAGCKVAYYADLTGTATQLDHNGHGSNVSGIVIGTAPGARIAMQNVFGVNNFTSDSLILQAINWGISNRNAYNIRAMNLSLGDGSLYTAPCTFGNPYTSAIQTAWNAGLITVASAGNEGFTNGISNPACTPNVLSVGAVYSTNWGGRAWSSCTDATTVADQVTCFSNSANFLTMLAPGALVTAGGSQKGGTSQASPFVAGAVAVLRSAFPGDTLTQTVARLTGTGMSVTDARNGIVKPRLNLAQALRPVNDLFVNATVVSGNSGSFAGGNVNASRESGEPNHAGDPGGASVWWKWTAPATGQVSLNTTGSAFQTLLAVYSGASVATLTLRASRTGNGVLLFQAVAGTQYAIAMDGMGGASGNLAWTWSLNTAAAADLVVTQSADATTVSSGSPVTFNITVGNNGPQTATGATASTTLPAGLSYLSASAGCVPSGQIVACAAGTIAGGGVASASITALTTGVGTYAVTTTGGSDLPDPATVNNTASTPITVTAGTGSNNARLPTLPHWAMTLLALGLAAAILRPSSPMNRRPQDLRAMTIIERVKRRPYQ